MILSELLNIKSTLKLLNTTFIKFSFLKDSISFNSFFAAELEGRYAVFETKDPTAVRLESFVFQSFGHSIFTDFSGYLEKSFIHVYIENA